MGVAILAALLLVATYWARTAFGTPYTGRAPIAFGAKDWLEGAHDPAGSRYLMLEDLLAQCPLVGMTREELESLLGPLIPPIDSNDGWRYYLGPEPSFASVDSIWLKVRFSSNRVADVWTQTD